MTRKWISRLALALSLSGSYSFGQYPSGYDNFGPSTFPVRSHLMMENVPQVPYGYQIAPTPADASAVPQDRQYELVGAQDQGASGAILNQNPPTTYQVPAPVDLSPPVPTTDAYSGGEGVLDSTNLSPSPMTTLGMEYSSVVPNGSYCGPVPVAPSDCNSTECTSQWGLGSVAGRLHTGLFSGMPCQARPWFFGAGTLFFNRVDCNSVPLSFADSAYAPDILTTNDALQGYEPGFEATIGRYFNCGRYALAFTYWGVYPNEESAVRTGTIAGEYRSRLPFNHMTMPGTPSAPSTPYSTYDWYDNAYAHSLCRSSNYQNVEINLLGFAMGGAARNFSLPTKGSLFGHHGKSSCGFCGGAGCDNCSDCTSTSGACAPTKFGTGPCCLTPPLCGSRCNLTWLAGFRYFRFDDNLRYASSLSNDVIAREADDLYYEVNTSNDLFGFQTGARLDYCCGRRVNLFSTLKVGVYNNHSTLYSRLGTDYENAYLNDTRTPANPSNGEDYLFDESKDKIAFLSEIGTGLGYRVTCNWTATFGYRAVIASGVATSTQNVRNSFANYADIRDYDNCGTLILHGFNFGGVYNF